MYQASAHSTHRDTSVVVGQESIFSLHSLQNSSHIIPSMLPPCLIHLRPSHSIVPHSCIAWLTSSTAVASHLVPGTSSRFKKLVEVPGQLLLGNFGKPHTGLPVPQLMVVEHDTLGHIHMAPGQSTCNKHHPNTSETFTRYQYKDCHDQICKN